MDFDYSTETITPDSTNLLTIGGTGALETPIGTTAQRPVSGISNGAIRYNTDLNVLEGYVNSAWATVVTGAAGASALSSITAATGPNSINNGDNAQTWNWALTTASKSAFTFTENTAAINGAGAQYLVDIGTIAASTANPIRIRARGNNILTVTAPGMVTLQAADDSAGNPMTVRAGNSSTAATIGGQIGVFGGNGNTTAAGGDAFFQGGAGGATGVGGNAFLNGGFGGATSGNGGFAAVVGGVPTDGNGGAVAIAASSGVGTNRSGGNVTITGGAATGSGVPGTITFNRNYGTIQIGQFTGAGSFVLGNAALATGAADGFLYLAGSAGTPAGTPTAFTGRSPITVDTTNNLLYFYTNGAWRASNAGTSVLLSSITAAAAANSINNGDNAQTWNWQLTTASKSAFTFTENTAATNGVGAQYLLDVGTIASSTANPIRIRAQGNNILTVTNVGVTTLQGADTGTGSAITVRGGNSSTAATAGGLASVQGGNGNTTGTGGIGAVTGGQGGATGVGGNAFVAGGAGGATSGNGGDAIVQGGTPTNGTGGNAFLVGGIGGTTSGNPGFALVQGGTPSATGNGSTATLRGSPGGATSGNAGTAFVEGGTPTDGNGGDVNITGAAGVGTNRNGGSVTITSGIRSGTGTAGNINLVIPINASLQINGSPGALNQALVSNGSSTPATWQNIVNSFSAGTTGLTPSTATTGPITLAGTLIAANGGTGFASYAVGDILYANTTTTLAKLADVAAGSYLRSGGVNTAPVWSTTVLPNSAAVGDLMQATSANTYTNLASVATGNALISGGVTTASSWGKIGLTTHVSGTLPIGNGGTNSSTALSGSSIMVSNGTSIIQGAAGTTTTVLHGNAAGAPTYSAVSLTADVSGVLPLANGGTNANLTAVNGGAVYSTGSALAITAAGTSGQVLVSAGAAAPVWTSTAGILQLYKENPSTPTAPTVAGTNAVAIGSGSAAPGNNSIAIGAGTSATNNNTLVIANGNFATAGDAQELTILSRNTTSNATPTQLFVDGSAQRLVLPNNSAWTFFIKIVGRRTDATGGYAMFTITGGITRDATAATTTLRANTRTVIAESTVAMDAAVTADTTNGSLNITVTGVAAQTIRWVATSQITQVTN